jgi:hypothetical protein
LGFYSGMVIHPETKFFEKIHRSGWRGSWL